MLLCIATFMVRGRAPYGDQLRIVTVHKRETFYRSAIPEVNGLRGLLKV